MHPELDELQAKIDASRRGASALTKELFAKAPMDAKALQNFINTVMSVSVATVGRSGRPHASLTMIACLNDGQIYFAANRQSVLYRNLQHSTYVGLTVDNQQRGLMAQGRAFLFGNTPDLKDLVTEADALMERGRWLPKDWDGALYRVDLHRIFAR